MNPFEILGLEPGTQIDEAELETRYLGLSREYHPDFNQGLAADEEVEMLTRSAELNDAYRLLRDPWSRAESTIRILDPSAMDKTKELSPMFLMDAMEARDEIEAASPDDWTNLKARVQQRVDQYFRDVSEHIADGNLREAATLMHQSNYYRKSLRDLTDRLHTA